MSECAGRYDICAYQGATVSRVFTWRDSAAALVNLTGYTAALKVRETPTSTALISLTHASGLTLGGAAGTITLAITATTMATIDEGRYVWDLLMTSGGGVKTVLLHGDFFVHPTVSL